MNLLILTSSFPRSQDDGQAAAGLFVADVARVLSDAGHQVTVATPNKIGSKGDWAGFGALAAWSRGDKAPVQIKLGESSTQGSRTVTEPGDRIGSDVKNAADVE